MGGLNSEGDKTNEEFRNMALTIPSLGDSEQTRQSFFFPSDLRNIGRAHSATLVRPVPCHFNGTLIFRRALRVLIAVLLNNGPNGLVRGVT